VTDSTAPGTAGTGTAPERMNRPSSAPDRAAPPGGWRVPTDGGDRASREIRCSRCRQKLYGREGESVTCPRCCRVQRV